MADLTPESRLALGRTAEIYAWEDEQVLKLFRPGWPAEDAEYEAGISRRIHQVGLPVAAVGDVITVDGRRGIVFQRLTGESMLDALSARPWAVRRYAKILAELHLALHRQSISGLPGQRQRLIKKIERAAALPASLRQAVLDHLARLPEEELLCHGDFHPANVILTSDGPVVIDWIDATAGHPLADVARTSLLARLGQLPLNPLIRLVVGGLRRYFLSSYLAHYFAQSEQPHAALRNWYAPIAAARIAEGIRGEEQRLVQMVRQGLG